MVFAFLTSKCFDFCFCFCLVKIDKGYTKYNLTEKNRTGHKLVISAKPDIFSIHDF